MRRISLLLGMLILVGASCSQHPSDSLNALQEKAEKGDADSQYKLALKYHYGEIVPKDDEEAMMWFRKAADQGLGSAQEELGLMYGELYNHDFGEDHPTDATEAAKWFRQAAEQGLPTSQFNLALRYASGVGVPVDKVESVKWARKAAEQGNSPAEYFLAEAQLTGIPKEVTNFPQLGSTVTALCMNMAKQGYSWEHAKLGVVVYLRDHKDIVCAFRR